MEEPGLEDIILDVKIPAEEVVEVRDGKKKITSRKFLPGYILIEMDMPDRGWKDACSQIKRIQGVTGFCRSDGNIKTQSNIYRRSQINTSENRRN